MKRILTLPIFVALLFLLLDLTTLNANSPPEKGGPLPIIRLPIPKDAVDKEYLGLSGEGSFKITEIKAKVVIIEIFSLYCPYCQSSAPGLNELFHRMENNPDLKGKIKLIGIGAGNSPYEVEIFKKTYNTPFPLFPDKDFTLHKALGDVRTPYFIAIKINDDGTHQVIHSELGGFKGAESFLELMLNASGLK